jgi:hypothetical protein
VITPRLFRRALRSALQWRLLLLFWASLLIPGAIAAAPVAIFLRRQLGHWTRAEEVVAWLDGSTAVELFRQVEAPGGGIAIGFGLLGGALSLLLIAPAMAGATAAAARSDEPLPLQRLLAGAGEFYGRMLRTFLLGLLPLGIGAAIAAGIFKLVERADDRAIWETQVRTHLRIGLAAAAVAVFLCHLLVDGARAHFVADPTRRSAFLALWSSLRLLVRRPLRMPALGVLGSVAGLGTALVLMAVRLRIEQRSAWLIAVAWFLAQGAQVAIGWGRGARIFGLADLARADAAGRAKALRMESAVSNPPARALSPTSASGT